MKNDTILAFFKELQKVVANHPPTLAKAIGDVIAELEKEAAPTPAPTPAN